MFRQLEVAPCRKMVGAAIAHFVLLAYIILRLFAREEPPTAWTFAGWLHFQE